MVYAVTLSEPWRVIHWRLIMEEIVPNIHKIYGIDNILAYMLIRILITKEYIFNTINYMSCGFLQKRCIR